jgi:hypothetical protein
MPSSLSQFTTSATLNQRTQADASAAEEMGLELDDQGNITQAGQEDPAQNANGGNDDACDEPDPALFVLKGRVLTTWEQSKVCITDVASPKA